ncbi:hypothetical protein [Streptomyces sp. NPDC050485]|uniref:hypothetical protein n=1 Tax=Streptomyces sp. NPDC050485 TaxID=3365617 RepID=UPI003790EAA1
MDVTLLTVDMLSLVFVRVTGAPGPGCVIKDVGSVEHELTLAWAARAWLRWWDAEGSSS